MAYLLLYESVRVCMYVFNTTRKTYEYLTMYSAAALLLYDTLDIKFDTTLVLYYTSSTCTAVDQFSLVVVCMTSTCTTAGSLSLYS